MRKIVTFFESFLEAAAEAKNNAKAHNATFDIKKEGNQWRVEGWAEEVNMPYEYLLTTEEEDYLWELKSGPDSRWSENDNLRMETD